MSGKLKRYLLRKLPLILRVLIEREFHLNAFRRKLNLTPMQSVLRELRKRQINLGSMAVLDVFGGRGDGYTYDYAPHVQSLEVWEMMPEFEPYLISNLPKAIIKITDSYLEIRKISRKYDLIVVDNAIYHPSFGGLCEHFELFPDIFRAAKDSTILILNVFPEISHKDLKKYPYWLDNVHKKKRSLFYKTSNPQKISLDHMLYIYREIIEANAFKLEWFFLQRRNPGYFLVLKINKST